MNRISGLLLGTTFLTAVGAAPAAMATAMADDFPDSPPGTMLPSGTTMVNGAIGDIND